MDHSNIPVFKRPTKLPTREELALIFNNKQQKHLQIQHQEFLNLLPIIIIIINNKEVILLMNIH